MLSGAAQGVPSAIIVLRSPQWCMVAGLGMVFLAIGVRNFRRRALS